LKLSFFRSFKFQAEVAQAPRLFNLKVGLCGPLDPESGMSVNLTDMDRWVQHGIELVQKGHLQSEHGVLEAVILCIEDQLSADALIRFERIELHDPVGQKTWTRTRQGETRESSWKWVVKSGYVYQLEEWSDRYELRDLVSGESILEKGRLSL
jgi:hypothetical protein